MNDIPKTVSVIGVPSENSPPVDFETVYSSGFVDAKQILELTLEEENKYPVYTAGFRGNPEHLWKIVDHAICAVETPAKNHSEPRYIILYYEPVNISAVLRDCAPHLLDLPEDVDSLLE